MISELVLQAINSVGSNHAGGITKYVQLKIKLVYSSFKG
jgi:hypothetical protein